MIRTRRKSDPPDVQGLTPRHLQMTPWRRHCKLVRKSGIFGRGVDFGHTMGQFRRRWKEMEFDEWLLDRKLKKEFMAWQSQQAANRDHLQRWWAGVCKQSSYVGMWVSKEFPGYPGNFVGCVSGFSEATKLYSVMYLDGDSERLQQHEAEALLVDKQQQARLDLNEAIAKEKWLIGYQERKAKRERLQKAKAAKNNKAVPLRLNKEEQREARIAARQQKQEEDRFEQAIQQSILYSI